MGKGLLLKSLNRENVKVEMAYVLLFWLVFMGCFAPQKSKPIATLPDPALNSIQKKCEEIFFEEVSRRWKKTDFRTDRPGFIRNDTFISRTIGDLKPCLIGKNKAFIISNLGKPSVELPGSIHYDCYPKGIDNIDSSRCLSFRVDTALKITNVLFWKCAITMDKGK